MPGPVGPLFSRPELVCALLAEEFASGASVPPAERWDPACEQGEGPRTHLQGRTALRCFAAAVLASCLRRPRHSGGSPAPQFEGGCCQLTRTGERVPFLRARSRVCHVKTKSSFLSPVRLWNIANVTCGTRTCGTRRDVSSWRNCSIFSICVSGAVNTLIC